MRNTRLIVAAEAVPAVAFVLLQGAGDDGARTSVGVSTSQAIVPAATTPAASAPSTTTQAAPKPKPEMAMHDAASQIASSANQP